MTKPIITVEGLGKAYKLGAEAEKYPTFRDAIAGAVKAPLKRLRHLSERTKEEDMFWALKDVSFEVQQGEVVGIIGRNGAGKSTLLKILSRITEPTAGRAILRGRVASLLEVGTGFHPELTGRENIYLNGSILGMKRAEIARKFDEIVDFAEVEKFLDTPVKRYSSGMYVRLAFAVAAHLEPEILIVDEVLAVGDAQFQKKCLGKMQDVAKGEGRTVLFVSHNMAAMQNLTQQCILLSHGTLDYLGSTEKAIQKYLIDTDVSISEDTSGLTRYCSELPHGLKIIRARLKGKSHGRTFREDQGIGFEIEVEALLAVPSFRVSLTIFANDDTAIGSVFGDEELHIPVGQKQVFCIELPNPHLVPGNYYIGLAVGTGNETGGHKDYDVLLRILPFEIIGRHDGLATQTWPSGWGRIKFDSLDCFEVEN